MKRISSFAAAGLAFAFVSASPEPAFAAPPAPQPSNGAPQMSRLLTVAESLKAAVAQAQDKFGTLEPWQKKLYEDEVLPQASRFVRDFRHTSNGMTVEVDQDGIRKYLAFYAPQALKRTDLKLLTFVKADAECEKCVEATDELKRLARMRAERRGFTPVWVTPEELDPKLAGKELSDKLAEMALKRNVAGALVLEARRAPIDAIDTAHADEVKFQVLSYFLARPEGQTELRHEGALEVLENDPLEVAAARLLNDAMTVFGAKTLLANHTEETRGAEEIAVTIRGVKDYAQNQKFKAQLQAGVRDGVAVEERRISRSQVVFGVRGNRSPSQVRDVVNTLSTENGRVIVTEAGATEIQAEVR